MATYIQYFDIIALIIHFEMELSKVSERYLYMADSILWEVTVRIGLTIRTN